MLVKQQQLSVSYSTQEKSHKIGEVHDGAATMDWMAQEQEKRYYYYFGCYNLFWNFPTNQGKILPESKQNLTLSIILVVDFTVEVNRSLRVRWFSILI